MAEKMTADRTTLVLPGKRMTVPKALKRAIQITLAVGLTALVVLAVLTVNALLVGKGTTTTGFNMWLAFMRRPDILATMALTASITVLFVYWQRDQERR